MSLFFMIFKNDIRRNSNLQINIDASHHVKSFAIITNNIELQLFCAVLKF